MYLNRYRTVYSLEVTFNCCKHRTKYADVFPFLPASVVKFKIKTHAQIYICVCVCIYVCMYVHTANCVILSSMVWFWKTLGAFVCLVVPQDFNIIRLFFSLKHVGVLLFFHFFQNINIYKWKIIPYTVQMIYHPKKSFALNTFTAYKCLRLKIITPYIARADNFKMNST